MSKKLRRKGAQCFNCHTQLLNSENFCPECGQENHNKQASTRMLIGDFLTDYIAFDSKLFRSIIPLLTKPGFITKEYLDGKRQKYIPPIRIFLFLSFIYFGLSYLLNEVGSEGSITLNGEEQGNEAGQAFYDMFTNNFNLVVFLFTPLQALLIMALYRTPERKFYVNFFVYTLHLFSFFFILGSFFVIFNAVLYSISDSITIDYILLGVAIALVIFTIIYSVKSLKLVFNKNYNILRYITVMLMSLTVFLLIMLTFIFILALIFQLNTEQGMLIEV